MKGVHLKIYVARLLKYLARRMPKPELKVVMTFLYVMVYTVGIKNSFLIVFRTAKEIKAMNLQPVARKRKVTK
jgi:hypothetical protein